MTRFEVQAETRVLRFELVRTGLTAFETGEADFADYVILGSARRQNALPLWTFDRHLANADGAEQVP